MDKFKPPPPDLLFPLQTMAPPDNAPDDEHEEAVDGEGEVDGEARQRAAKRRKPDEDDAPAQTDIGDDRAAAQPSADAPRPLSAETAALAPLAPALTQPCPLKKDEQPLTDALVTGVDEDEPVPPFDLRLMLWNLQDLGGGPSRGPRRSDATIEAIARIIRQADPDVAAIVEVHRKGGMNGGELKRRSLQTYCRGHVTRLELAVLTWFESVTLIAHFNDQLSKQKKSVDDPDKFLLNDAHLSEREKRNDARDKPLLDYLAQPQRGLETKTIKFKRRSDSKEGAAISDSVENRGSAARLLDRAHAAYLPGARTILTKCMARVARASTFATRAAHWPPKVRAAVFGTPFAGLGSARVPGELAAWIDLWRRNEEEFENPSFLFARLAANSKNSASLADIEIDALLLPQIQQLLNGRDEAEAPEAPPVTGSMSDKTEPEPTHAAEGGSDDQADSTLDHIGFMEIDRIVQRLNELHAGVDKGAVPKQTVNDDNAIDVDPVVPPRLDAPFASFPTLQEVQAADGPEAGNPYYTRGESYGFIYRNDRCQRAAGMPAAGQVADDFALLGGFAGRAPGRATLLFSDAEIDLIAHHPPAESGAPERWTLRSRDFEALRFALAQQRASARLSFYLGDTNANTRGALSEPLPEIGPQSNGQAWTNRDFLAMLSDDSVYPLKSLFAHAPTSHRKSAFRKTGSLMNIVRAPGFSGEAALPAGVAARVGQAITALRHGQDSYDSKAKAFDKIAVVRGTPWARVTREWVVPLLHAVAPPDIWGGSALFPERPGPRMKRFRHILGKETALFAALARDARLTPAATAGVGKSAAASDRAAAKNQLTMLSKIVNLMSDHAPCLAEYTVQLPPGYRKAALAASGAPRARGANDVLPTLNFPTCVAALTPPAQAVQVPEDGREGLMTAASAAPVMIGNLPIRRVACLQQTRNSCGVRAVWNAAALDHGSAAMLGSHTGLYAETALEDGVLPVDAYGEAVAIAIEAQPLAAGVAFLAHFAELEFMRDLLEQASWRRLCEVGQRREGVSAVLVVNTIAALESVFGARQGYGHYFAVRLDVQAGVIQATYADSLAGASEAHRHPFIANLVREIIRWSIS